MNITPLSEISDMADGLPVICVEGIVKYAGKISKGRSEGGTDWSRQFFVLAQNGAEVGCTLWDAAGNEVKKGEQLRIENTQNKKGQWSAITKSSYEKEGKTNHTLEIRAEQSKIKPLSGGERQTSEANISAARRDDPPPQSSDGVNEARQRIMQDANLMLIAMEGARYVAQQWREKHDCEIPNEHFQALCHCFFIEVSSRRTTDGVNWWSYVDKMPEKPVNNSKEKVERPPINQEDNEDVPF